MNNKPISLRDFKNWMAEQRDFSEFFNIDREVGDDTNAKFIGKTAVSKVREKKLIERIETEENADVETLVREFLEEGGTILSIEGKKVQIEVDSGTFYVPTFCLKIQKSE